MTKKNEFLSKIANQDATIGVIGLGYVGLPLMIGFAELGFSVIGFDIDENKIAKLGKGESYIEHINADSVAKMMSNPRCRATSDFSEAANTDALLICVPTPLTKNREPDISYIAATAKAIAPYLQVGQLITLESTTYPGTTREILLPILEEGSGLRAHEDFFVAYSPEREDPGNSHFGTTSIPKVVGADTPDSLEVAVALYETVVPQVIPVSSTDTAEAVKLTENIYRAVNVALVNELKMIFSAMDIDVWEVIEAAKTKPFGFTAFYPGPGLGGHCIPIDPFYLTWKAREFKLNTRFIELAGEINHYMPQYVVSELARALNDKKQKSVKGSRVLIVGLAYKKNVDDTRESPSLELTQLLHKLGAELDYYDPHISQIPTTRKYPELAGKNSVEWSAKNINSYDAILISTDHDQIDWKLLAEQDVLIIDTRNVMSKYIKDENSGNLVKA